MNISRKIAIRGVECSCFGYSSLFILCLIRIINEIDNAFHMQVNDGLLTGGWFKELNFLGICHEAILREYSRAEGMSEDVEAFLLICVAIGPVCASSLMGDASLRLRIDSLRVCLRESVLLMYRHSSRTGKSTLCRYRMRLHGLKRVCRNPCRVPGTSH